MGKMITVSGEVFGTGTNEYLDAINLPAPFGYDGSAEYVANAVCFLARNQSTGAYEQMRVGGNFKIYLNASMTVGVAYAFGFSYCAA